MEIVDMEVREAGDGAASGECVRIPPKKYTWAEVRQAVHDLRKELSSMSTMVPMAISFRKLANGKTRIYFLRTPQNGWEITLLYTDVTPSIQPNNTRLEWKPLIESNVALGVTSGKWSREEQLLWERQRVAAWGIASYELHQQTGRVLFPCASSLFVAEESPVQPPPLIPRSLDTGGGAPLTPAMCPRAPDLVAYAARGDIWLCGGGLRRPTRLTYACKGREPERLADDPRQAGVPSYVTQEEFSRYTGLWWQPTADDDVYRIVYEEVDESEVKIFSFPSSQTTSGDVEEFRFPRAGTPNAKSILRLVTFRLQRAGPTVLDYYRDGADEVYVTDSSKNCMEAVDIRWWDLHQPLKEAFPWFEYLARVGWTPCGQYVWVQLLDRKQQRLELSLIPLALFRVPAGYEHAPAPYSHEAAFEPVSPCEEPIQVLVCEEAPDAWVNVHDVLHFLPRAGGRVSLLWGSESCGHLHLYHITCQLRAASDPAGVSEQGEGSGAVRAAVLAREPVTAGDWEVMPRNIWVDEARQLVYFVGLRETPLERHLYCAPLQPPRAHQPALLTAPGHSCTVNIDHECSMAVITTSNISCVPSTRVFRIEHGAGVSLVAQGTLMERAEPETSDLRGFNGAWDECGDSARLVVERPLSAGTPAAELFCTRLSCGARAYCTLWRARGAGGAAGAGASAGARAPTVLHVYGGPEVQTVTNSYKGIRQLRMAMLAARGFNVVAVDSRGSKHRGRAWEAAIRGKLGQVELDDQVEVLQWLAKETGCIDMERVAIHGWSYGGYLSLLGLATRPNVFKVCVAGAPVTCWRLYDTAYTERYMGPPARAPHAYTRASVLAHAPFFPDQEGRLLIIHGLADENVHFCHTAALLAELVRLGKPHRVQVYPGERHSLRAMHAAKHYETTLLHFLHENL